MIKLQPALAIIAVACVGCAKNPKAAFTTDKDVYARGETMLMSNQSENAETYHWTVSNSLSEFNSREPEIPASVAGECVITLKAFSKNNSKTNSASRTVTITPGEGELTFYAQTDAALSSTVLIGSLTLGPPTQTYGAIPECRAAGTLTASLDEGPATFTVVTPSATTAFSLEVEANVCKKIRL